MYKFKYKAYTNTRHLGDAVQHARTPKQKDLVELLQGLFALAKGSTYGKHINIFIGDLYSCRK